MQPNTPLPINAFLSKFPVKMTSTEDPSWQAPVQTGADIMDNFGFDFQASTNVNGDQSGHTASAQNAPETGDFPAVGRIGENLTGYAPASTAIQDTTYTFQNEGPSTYARVHSGNMDTNSVGVACSNPGQIQSSFPMTSRVYNQQDFAAPNSHNYVQSSTSMPSEQHHIGGSLAFVVIPGVPTFNIPIEVANMLMNMYRMNMYRS